MATLHSWKVYGDSGKQNKTAQFIAVYRNLSGKFYKVEVCVRFFSQITETQGYVVL